MDNQRHVGRECRIVSNLIKRKLDNMFSKKFGEGFTGIHSWIIAFIYNNQNKEIFQKDVEEEFSIRRSTATSILQLMEKNGLIVRNSVEYDARLKKLELTDKAIKVHEMIGEEIDTIESQIVKGLTEEEVETFFRIADVIINNLK